MMSSDRLVPMMAVNLGLLAGKVTHKAIRLLGAGFGSNLPGRVARTISPELLTRLAAQSRKGVLAVSGTNGKSTTAGLIASILRSSGLKVVHNRQGANLITGITASLVEAASWDGKLDADYCLFEVDEAALPLVAAAVPIQAVVVTNLFRDQLDRFGELDVTARLISRGIELNGSTAILNADDPNVAQLAFQCARMYYGIESVTGVLPDSGNMELSYCVECGQEYRYSRVFYGQLGHYQCRCGSKRPSPQICARNIALSPVSSSFILEHNKESYPVKLNLPGLYNVYNSLAAAAMAHWLGIPGVTIEEGLSNYTTLFGRSETLTVEGRSVLIQLIKNPAGATQVLGHVSADSKSRLLIAINDNLADGRDVSWLWDADFELLSGHDREIVVSGQRAEDMAVRLKYAGFASDRITVIPSISKALAHAVAATGVDETLWVLPTYTCLLELQRIFKKTMGRKLAET